MRKNRMLIFLVLAANYIKDFFNPKSLGILLGLCFQQGPSFSFDGRPITFSGDLEFTVVLCSITWRFFPAYDLQIIFVIFHDLQSGHFPTVRLRIITTDYSVAMRDTVHTHHTGRLLPCRWTGIFHGMPVAPPHCFASGISRTIICVLFKGRSWGTDNFSWFCSFFPCVIQ